MDLVDCFWPKVVKMHEMFNLIFISFHFFLLAKAEMESAFYTISWNQNTYFMDFVSFYYGNRCSIRLIKFNLNFLFSNNKFWIGSIGKIFDATSVHFQFSRTYVTSKVFFVLNFYCNNDVYHITTAISQLQ